MAQSEKTNSREKNVHTLLEKLTNSLNILEKILDPIPGELVQEEKNTIQEKRDFIIRITESIQSTLSSGLHGLLNMHLELAEKSLPGHIDYTKGLIESVTPLALLESIKNLAEKTQLWAVICSSQRDWVNKQNEPTGNLVEGRTKLKSYKLSQNLIKEFEEKSKEWEAEFQEIIDILTPVTNRVKAFLEELNELNFGITQAKKLEKALQFLLEEKLAPLGCAVRVSKKEITEQDSTVEVDILQLEQPTFASLPPIRYQIAQEELSKKCEEIIAQRLSLNKNEPLAAGRDSPPPVKSKCQRANSQIIYTELGFANNNSPPRPRSTGESVSYATLVACISASKSSLKHLGQSDSGSYGQKMMKSLLKLTHAFKNEVNQYKRKRQASTVLTIEKSG